MDRNRIILEEAEAWRKAGRVTPEFHAWIKAEYAAQPDAQTTTLLQRILVAAAGVLVFVGIVTLVAQFWDALAPDEKFLTLLGFTLLALILGVALYHYGRTRMLSNAALALALPLYLFAMVYPDDPGFRLIGPDETSLNLGEVAIIAAGLMLALALFGVGLWRLPALALTTPPGLVTALLFLALYQNAGEATSRLIQWTMLAVVALIFAALFLLWAGTVRLPFSWHPLSGRLAMASNVIWGFALILILVESYAYDAASGREIFDAELVAPILVAVYLAILMAFALRWGLPELTAVSGLFLVIDAIMLGAQKGGLIGAVIAIFATAAALLVLAQRGVLGRIFKPRPPPGRIARAIPPTRAPPAR